MCLVTKLPDHAPMYITLAVDRNSFDGLKKLLRKKSAFTAKGYNPHPHAASLETSNARINREALKRLFDQIRDVEYNDK